MFQSGYNADDKTQVHKWSIRASEAISPIKCVMAIFNAQFEQTAKCRFSQQKKRTFASPTSQLRMNTNF
jgi:hypothetical protein